MPSKRYYGDEGTLSATINGTTVDVAEARGVTVTPAADHNEFYGPDDIERQDVKRSNFRVDVEIEIAEFDDDFVQYWLQGGGTTDDTKATTPQNTHNVTQFQVTAEEQQTSGDFKLKAVVNETHFPEMPAIDFAEGEYSTRSMTGTGSGITFTNESV